MQIVAPGHRAVPRFQLGQALHVRRRARRKRRSRCSGPGIPSRMAKFNGDQGCAILPRGETGIHFKPVVVPRNLPDAGDTTVADGRCQRRCRTAERRRHRRARLGLRAEGTQHPRDRRRASAARSSASATRRGGPRTRRKSAGRPARASPPRWSASSCNRAQLKVDDVAPIKEWRGQRRSAPRDSGARPAAHEQRT